MNRYLGILNGGSLAGLFAFLWFLVLYFAMGAEFVMVDFSEEFLREAMTIRIHPFSAVRAFGVVIPSIFMFRYIKQFKIEEGEGFITFGRAFQVGVMFTFIYASLTAMLIFLFGSLVDGSFVDFANTHDLRVLELTKEAGESVFVNLDEQMELIEQRDLGSFALMDFWKKTSSGFIIALIVAAVLKQKPPTFADND
ncbi:MAG: DUF4199 domain-containing protein [Cryomorphaceae bacterium]